MSFQTHISPLFFTELENDFPLIREAFVKSFDEESVRQMDQALLIFQRLKEIHLKLGEIFKQYPAFTELFNKQYLSYKKISEREQIVETCFLEDSLIPQDQNYLFLKDDQVDTNALQTFQTEILAWGDTQVSFHKATQEQVKEHFELELRRKDLSCQCTQCLGAYRTRLREFLYKEQMRLIVEAHDQIKQNLSELSFKDMGQEISQLRKKLDKNFFRSRYHLRRSSLSKLESQTRTAFRDYFSPTSELGKQHSLLVLPLLKEHLRSESLNQELITPEEYQRFFTQIDLGLWKPEHILLKEFAKFVRSVLSYKRRDISGNILREYLGQFWIHSKARLIKRKIIYHQGPTNSGKTHHAVERLCESPSGCYLAPLRLLAGELYDRMTDKGVKTTLLTGEEVIDTPDATHYSSTIEMAKLQQRFDTCVIDEIQMISDPQRGWAWTRALINICADEVHICGDDSVMELVQQILKLTGDELEVRQYERMTPLETLGHTLPLTQLEKGDALIVFSRRNALKYKADLEDVGFKVSIVYGRLGPEVRREQARKFDQGETDIMVSTDAIAMGMNLPIQRIIFSTLSKNFNSKEYHLNDSEIKQISGRAGRYGRYPTGYVSCLTRVQDGLERIDEALEVELDQKDFAMVGPDVEIFNQVNQALATNSLPELKLSEFLRLFNAMSFERPFYCVDLKEMIEVAEMVEAADEHTESLTHTEIFGFACAPVNLGLIDHVQYFVWILNRYVANQPIYYEPIDSESDDIDYLETSIKCVELYQWLARHFSNKNFSFETNDILINKGAAIEKLNTLLSNRITKSCSSCGKALSYSTRFHICDECFNLRRQRQRHRHAQKGPSQNSSRNSKKGRKRPARR